MTRLIVGCEWSCEKRGSAIRSALTAIPFVLRPTASGTAVEAEVWSCEAKKSEGRSEILVNLLTEARARPWAEKLSLLPFESRIASGSPYLSFLRHPRVGSAFLHHVKGETHDEYLAMLLSTPEESILRTPQLRDMLAQKFGIVPDKNDSINLDQCESLLLALRAFSHEGDCDSNFRKSLRALLRQSNTLDTSTATQDLFLKGSLGDGGLPRAPPLVEDYLASSLHEGGRVLWLTQEVDPVDPSLVMRTKAHGT